MMVDGKEYKVTENLGFQGGHCAKAVDTPDGERIAVKRGSAWSWWTEQDRRCPPSRYVGMEEGA